MKATHFHAWSTQLKTIILIATCVAFLSYFIILSNYMYFLCVNCTFSMKQCCCRTSLFHLVYIQLFYLCFLLLAFVSGHHHSHHPVSVGGSSFPMSTMFTHNHTRSNTTHLWDDTVTIKAHFYLCVCVTLPYNINKLASLSILSHNIGEIKLWWRTTDLL